MRSAISGVMDIMRILMWYAGGGRRIKENEVFGGYKI